MSTKKLAKELGLIRKRTPSSSSRTHTLSASEQLFSYLIIIDFESTCWREKNNHGQEIIEFPAVLMNTHTGQIESEFHSYVQPQEHPLLSSFCTELTGITQEQVEAGLPLQICLSRFTRWLHTLQQERGVVFLRNNTHTTAPGKPCTFLTWSDWDLGVCLQYECKRKQIPKPEALNSWIDLRATYRIFYHRKPKGLNGALQDLGIEFSGREHSGVDDARNTARLAWHMIKDGCMMKITKSLSRAPLISRVSLGVRADRRVCNESKEKQPTHTSDTHTGSCTVTSSHTSLVSLRTVLSSITPLHTLIVTHTSHPDTCATHPSHPDTGASHPDTGATHPSHLDTGATHTSHPDTGATHTSHPDTAASDWSEEFVLTEFGESGSYDDVIFEDVSESMPHYSPSSVYKRTPWPLDSNPPCLIKDLVKSLKKHNTRTTPTIPFSIYNDQSHHSSSSSSSVFRVPSNVPSSTYNQSARRTVSVNSSALNQSAHAYYSVNQSDDSISLNQSARRSVSVNQSALSCISVNKSSHSCFSINQTLPSCSVNQSALFSCKQLPLPPLRGGAEDISRITNKSNISSLSSISINQPALPSVSINQSAFSTSSTKQLPLPPLRGGVKITAPLCDCGRRSRRLTVCNGGPNHGRAFYACAGRRSSGPASRDSTNPDSAPLGNGCGFFKWESALIKSSAVSRNTLALSFNLSTPAFRKFR